MPLTYRSVCAPHQSRAAVCISVIAAVSCLAIGGCEGRQQRRMGKTYMAAGDYDRAVESAKAAVAEDPSNPASLDLLSDAQTAAADYHFGEARKQLSAHRPSDAMVSLTKALEYMPAHPGANTTKVTAESAIQKCRDLTLKAREAVGREDWEQAIVLAQQAVEIDQGDSTARSLFDHARTTLVARHTAAAQAALDAGDIQAALDACGQARKWDPQNSYLAQLEASAKDGAGRAEVAAGPNAPGTPDTQPALVASAEPVRADSPAAGDLSSPAVRESAQVPAQAGEAEPAAPVVRHRAPLQPKRAEDDRVPPRLVRQADDAGSRGADPTTQPAPVAVADAPAQAGVVRDASPLIEAHPVALQPVRPAQSGQKPSPISGGHGQQLITVDPGRTAPTTGGDQQAQVQARGAGGVTNNMPRSPSLTQSAGPSPEQSQAVPGAITDIRRLPQVSLANPAARDATPGTRALGPASGQARPGTAQPAVKAEPKLMFRGALSREEKRYKNKIAVMDGISIKLRDTDGDPLDADFEIVAGKLKVKPDDVPVGGRIQIRGASGRAYVMTVVWIDHDQETVHFTIDRVE